MHLVSTFHQIDIFFFFRKHSYIFVATIRWFYFIDDIREWANNTIKPYIWNRDWITEPNGTERALSLESQADYNSNLITWSSRWPTFILSTMTMEWPMPHATRFQWILIIGFWYRTETYLTKSWCFSDNWSNWILDYKSLYDFQHVYAFVVIKSVRFGTHVAGFILGVLQVFLSFCVWSVLFKNFWIFMFFVVFNLLLFLL
jgi:hypothetical protein